jgi:hypothetical protein
MAACGPKHQGDYWWLAQSQHGQCFEKGQPLNAAVDTLLRIAPQCRGVFHAADGQSGTVAQWLLASLVKAALRMKPQNAGFAFLGC